MNLGQDIAAAMPALRAAAESRMTAHCVITRAGEPVWNPVTMQNDETPVTVFEGPCRVRLGGSQDQAKNAADQSFIASLYVLSLPVVGSEGVRAADVVRVVSAPDDPALPGTVFTVVAAPAYSQGTARRFPVRETQ